jgi:hypothetical protein
VIYYSVRICLIWEGNLVEKAYVDDLIAEYMQDDNVKTDMLKEKIQLDLDVNSLQTKGTSLK